MRLKFNFNKFAKVGMILKFNFSKRMELKLLGGAWSLSIAQISKNNIVFWKMGLLPSSSERANRHILLSSDRVDEPGIKFNLRSEVLTAEISKVQVLWFAMPFPLVNIYHVLKDCIIFINKAKRSSCWAQTLSPSYHFTCVRKHNLSHIKPKHTERTGFERWFHAVWVYSCMKAVAFTFRHRASCI